MLGRCFLPVAAVLLIGSRATLCHYTATRPSDLGCVLYSMRKEMSTSRAFNMNLIKTSFYCLSRLLPILDVICDNDMIKRNLQLFFSIIVESISAYLEYIMYKVSSKQLRSSSHQRSLELHFELIAWPSRRVHKTRSRYIHTYEMANCGFSDHRGLNEHESAVGTP